MKTLAIFAKHPVPGAVKSRLAAETSPEWAARVADAFIRDLTDKLTRVNADRVLVYATVGQVSNLPGQPLDAKRYFKEVAGEHFRLVLQQDGDLGVRLVHFIDQQLRGGSEQVIVIGSDSPTLPIARIDQAFEVLEAADVVLGPAMDGGYYLIGCRRLLPIFDGISWGTAQVLGQTIARVSNTDAKLALLPPWYDVDTLADWWTLKGHTDAMRRAGEDPEIPCTETLLAASVW